MNEDRIIGTARNLGGKVQEGLGKVTGDTRTEAEGILNQAAGTAQDVYGRAKDVTAEAADSVTRKAAETGDYVRDFIETRPYTTAFTALFVGWVLAHLVKRA
jgi:uncharacterized protein YjbJ (UPF0337 family)